MQTIITETAIRKGYEILDPIFFFHLYNHQLIKEVEKTYREKYKCLYKFVDHRLSPNLI